MSLKNFPLAEALVGTVAGAVDGFVSSSDVNAGRTKWQHRRAVWVQGGMLAAGVGGSFVGLSTKYTEPLIGAAAVLGAREIAFNMAQKGQATPMTAWGRSVSSGAQAPHLAAAAAYNPSGLPAAAPAHQFVQSVSSLG
jgi:hypothetical protein